MSTEIISVGGTSRSGSTMLHLMLAGASDAVAVGEALSWFRPTKVHHLELSCACGKSDCLRWKELRKVKESHFHAAVAEETGARFVIDSSKETSWMIDTRKWARDHGMKVSSVFVWKDPLELSYSFWKRTGDPDIWRYEFLTYYKRLAQTGIPLVAVKLGDVLANPGHKLSQLCDALGMEYVDGMERFWETEHHHLFGNYGVKRQAQMGESFFQAASFSPEFQVYVDRLRHEIEQDEDVNRLVEVLHASDVSKAGRRAFESDRVRLSHPLPVWYYGQKAKRRIRRFKPKTTDLDRSHSVATIPVEKREE